MASGDLLGHWTPHDACPPASAYATLDTRNSVLVADFDASTDESLVFHGVLPLNYAGGGLTFDIDWAASSATSGAARWAVAIERANTDLDSDSFAAAKTAGSTTSGTSGILTRTSISFTSGAEMDSLAAGEPFRVKLTRDADGTSGTDDMTGDAELFALSVRET